MRLRSSCSFSVKRDWASLKHRCDMDKSHVFLMQCVEMPVELPRVIVIPVTPSSQHQEAKFWVLQGLVYHSAVRAAASRPFCVSTVFRGQQEIESPP